LLKRIIARGENFGLDSERSNSVIQLASWYQRKLRRLDRFHLGRKSGKKAANPLHGVIYIYEKLQNLTSQKHSDSSAMGETKVY